jgi:hypothetical protein
LFSSEGDNLGAHSAEGDEPTRKAVVDSGASLTISAFRDDFIHYEKKEGLVIHGLTKGAPILGIGIVVWHVEVGDKIVPIKIRALHVPTANKRLLCPQQLLQEVFPDCPDARIGKRSATLYLPTGTIHCPHNASNIPEISIVSPKETLGAFQAYLNCLTLEGNQNLSASQKELLRWHVKFGHCDLRRVQRILKTGAFGDSPLIKAAANLDLNKDKILCGSCAFGKSRRRAKTQKEGQGHTRSRQDLATKLEQLLSKDILFPGQKISMDHFIVTTPGRLFSSRGRESDDRMYKGRVIFYDHASKYIHIEPVVNFSAGEALRAKRAFEAEMLSMGIQVLNYHSDNGVFTAQAYQDELAKLHQKITLSGVGAHHQNGSAERQIGVSFGMARTMMLHAKMRWPKAIGTKLWPMAIKHAQHILNHLPDENNICPLDLVLKTTVPRSVLRNLHVWGCPAYVLDPRLQDGGHIPKFEPRSRLAVNLGWSPMHASTVPLVLNLTTGHVSPQFHILFDDWFTTVSSSEMALEDDFDSKQWT